LLFCFPLVSFKKKQSSQSPPPRKVLLPGQQQKKEASNKITISQLAFASSWSKERTKTVQQAATTTTVVEQSLDASFSLASKSPSLPNKNIFCYVFYS